MSYEKLGFVSGQTLKAEHLNHMEDGIANISWNDLQDRPFWKEPKKVSVFPDGQPLTVETIDDGTFNIAQNWFFVPPDVTSYVVFDGVEYECEPYYDDMERAYCIGSLDFSKYPFFITNGIIVTQTAGMHTVDHYYKDYDVKTDYCPHLVVYTKQNEDRTPYIDMEDVEKIKDAFWKGVPIILFTNYGSLGVAMHVSDMTDSTIYASGTDIYYGLVLHMAYQFTVRDGAMCDQASSYLGSVEENGDTYPVMYIRNRPYKITVDNNGKLTATEVK